jgi:hypothetical protein
MKNNRHLTPKCKIKKTKVQSDVDRLTFALESFKNIQDLIKFVDQKSGAILVVTGLIFTGYAQFIEGLIFVEPNNVALLGILTFVASLSTFTSLIFVIYLNIFKVLKPRKAIHYKKDESSLFYYEHIYGTGKVEILNKYESIDEKTMLKNIIEQQHEIARILKLKTDSLNKSLNWLFASVLSVMMFILLSNQL